MTLRMKRGTGRFRKRRESNVVGLRLITPTSRQSKGCSVGQPVVKMTCSVIHTAPSLSRSNGIAFERLHGELDEIDADWYKGDLQATDVRSCGSGRNPAT